MMVECKTWIEAPAIVCGIPQGRNPTMSCWSPHFSRNALSSQTMSPAIQPKLQRTSIPTALVSTHNSRLFTIVIPDGAWVIPIGNMNFDMNVDFG